ncbi:hypothetical protein FLP41_04170 [Paracoccus marcusii]|uniref:TVP38/TMEM64 family protein n=1 Tax=Paracoccus marcusii TaxID=59779 RepID=UPI002ED1864A|nr:hypothetical protein FLP41_04170 [Paracoccus marcusii]
MADPQGHEGNRVRKATVLVAFLGLVLAALWLLAAQDIDLPALRDRLATLGAIQQDNPLTVAALFFAAYVAVTALSLPIAVWLTLAGGALFGFWTGLALVSFASAVGATLAFLASRYVLRDWVRARLGSRAERSSPGLRGMGLSISSRCDLSRSCRSLP